MLEYLVKQPPAPPSNDKRWKLVNAAMRRHGFETHALIETLHAVQDAFGYLDDEALRYVATALCLPMSQVYGVATFYHYFTLKPQGRHTCVLCTGTACYIKGGPAILAAVEREYGVRPGETTEDGAISLLSARCLGSCGLAPAAVFDGEVAGKLDEQSALAHLGKWGSHDAE